jgi:hypothetical protein
MRSISTRGRLLLTEAAALLPILRATPAADFDRPTPCPGWSVQDVLLGGARDDRHRPVPPVHAGRRRP